MTGHTSEASALISYPLWSLYVSGSFERAVRLKRI
jgi:hypothetical protein